MRRLSPTLLLGCALAFFGCVHVGEPDHAVAPARWPHEVSDLKPDPAVVWGRLENGLRYAILPHRNPPRRASAFLLVEAGSYHERERELGYAHFVEHMAFRGLRGFPDGIFTTVERLGGAADAKTAPFETKYSIDHVPVENPAALDTTLQLLRAVADGVLFEPAAIASERGVIFNEQLTRSAMMTNARSDELEFAPPRDVDVRWPELCALYNDTRLIARWPMGDEGLLRAANATKLRRFYDRWYRPERMILAVVGDVRPTEIEALVRETFSSLRGRGRRPGEPPPPMPKPPDGIYAHLDIQNEEPAMLVSVCSHQARSAPDTIARRRQSLVRSIALDMLVQRLERVTYQPNAPLSDASALLCHYVPGAELMLLRATTSPPSWTNALAALDYETRRAITQGFAAAELQRAVKSETVSLAAAARQAGQRSSADLAQALAFAVARDVVFTAPDDDRDLAAAQLAAITEAECQAALREMYPAERLALAFIGPFPEATPAFEPIGKALDESRAAELTAFVPPSPPQPFPFTDFGPAGRVIRSEHSALLEADLLQFENGVRLNFKRTQFEPGHVKVFVRIEGGRMACPPEKPGIDLHVAGWVFGGLEGLSREEENAALLDLTGSSGFGSSESEFHVNGHETAANLPLWLQSRAAYFVRPAFRNEAVARGLEFARGAVAGYSSTASGVATVELLTRLARRHPATWAATFEQASRLTLPEVKEWLLPQLATAPMEITIVGDIDSAEAIEAVARTFGALPPRNTADPFAEQRRISYPPPPFRDTIDFDGKKGVAAVTLAWPMPDSEDYAQRFRAEIAGKILEQRLWRKLRIEMGAGYALEAGFAAQNAFQPALAFVSAKAEVAPERIEPVTAAMREVAETLARQGATREEFERALQPLVRETESGLENNDWWLDLLMTAQSDPVRAGAWAHALEHYRSITLEQINAALPTLLSANRRCELIVRPR